MRLDGIVIEPCSWCILEGGGYLKHGHGQLVYIHGWTIYRKEDTIFLINRYTGFIIVFQIA